MPTVVLGDMEAVAKLINLCAIDQAGSPRLQAGDLESDWRLPHVQPERECLVGRTADGQVVGYAAVCDPERHVHLMVRAGVHANHRGLDLGTMLCRWLDERGCRSLAWAPPGVRLVLVQELPTTDLLAQELLQVQGYRAVHRELRMRIDLHASLTGPSVPEGIRMRLLLPRKEKLAMVGTLRGSFQGHWGLADRPVEEDLADWTHCSHSVPGASSDLRFVAMAGEEMVGTCLCHPTSADDPQLGYIFALRVRHPWRRKGVALALLQHTFGALYCYGLRRAGPAVDAQNTTGAMRFYERAGTNVDGRYVLLEKVLRPGARLDGAEGRGAVR